MNDRLIGSARAYIELARDHVKLMDEGTHKDEALRLLRCAQEGLRALHSDPLEMPRAKDIKRVLKDAALYPCMATIRNWTSGKTRVSHRAAEAIASGLGIPLVRVLLLFHDRRMRWLRKYRR